MRRKLSFLCLLLSLPVIVQAQTQNVDTKALTEMRWRNVGPFRGGRTRALSGVPSQPNVFYIGAVNGGVWKSTDYGRTWQPIFDQQPTGSIGAIVVAPSDPKIVYVGSGEGLHRPDLSVGDGIYKSTDGGKTWTHLGLRDGQQISQMAVDPHNPDRLFVAVAGHPYGPNPERGIYRSTDGAKTFEKVLYKNENIGAAGVVIDPSDPNVVYATLWEAREGPWENGDWNGAGGGIFKSTDGGNTWKQLAGGLPEGIVQAYVSVAAQRPQTSLRLGRRPKTRSTSTLPPTPAPPGTPSPLTRVPKSRIGGGDLPVPMLDPKNPDVVYMTSTVTWKSTDGGKTWTGFRGAPGGDDYQNIWINPNDPNTILLVSDQGAIVTVNGGESWSSWYNQPTAQMYHVAADNAFPYRLCSGQQESGSACISSRGNDGEITFRDWHPVARGRVRLCRARPARSRHRLRRQAHSLGSSHGTGAIHHAPGAAHARFPRRPHPAGHVLAGRSAPALFRGEHSLDDSRRWPHLEADQSRPHPQDLGCSRQRRHLRHRSEAHAARRHLRASRLRRSTSTASGPAPTTDSSGSPPTAARTGTTSRRRTLTAWQKVSILEASHTDPNTAYAAINTLRLDDLRPHILRTRDGGKTWTEIVNGIPDNENVNAVREDPKRKGLLFAGTERTVYVSFDDGDHWQSLRLNLPATSVRDLIIKDDDLAIGTHGRGFWILDDITPLRQIDDKVVASNAYLFEPELAYRVRWNMNTDTPLPPDEPAGQNPPDGAILDYYLGIRRIGPR